MTQGLALVLPAGAPTSVGSLPHLDRDAAIDFVLDRTPELPAAPTCPAVDPLELMIPQAAWGIAGVNVALDGTISVPDPMALDPSNELGDPDLLGAPFATWRRFIERVATRQGPVKLQVTGPLTLGTTLVQAGVPAKLAYAVAARSASARARAVLPLEVDDDGTVQPAEWEILLRLAAIGAADGHAQLLRRVVGVQHHADAVVFGQQVHVAGRRNGAS